MNICVEHIRGGERIKTVQEVQIRAKENLEKKRDFEFKMTGQVMKPNRMNKAVRVGWADVGGAEAWASYQLIGTQRCNAPTAKIPRWQFVGQSKPGSGESQQGCRRWRLTMAMEVRAKAGYEPEMVSAIVFGLLKCRLKMAGRLGFAMWNWLRLIEMLFKNSRVPWIHRVELARAC
ncbi:hypothetical protein ACLOJK_027040 [Asimina triloba]